MPDSRISRPTARMLRGIMNGEAGSDGIRPDALQITRHKKDVFSFEIINADGDPLVNVCQVELKVGGSASLTHIYRTFNFSLGGT